MIIGIVAFGLMFGVSFGCCYLAKSAIQKEIESRMRDSINTEEDGFV